jgi:hypothetical protein
VGQPGAADVDLMTWAVSNPIYLRPVASVPRAAPARVSAKSNPLGAQGSWGVEHSTGSEASVAPAGTGGVTLTYALAPGERASQYAALVTTDVGGIADMQWMKVVL